MWLLLSVAACIPVLTSPSEEKTFTGKDWVATENSWGLCEEPPDSLVGQGLAVGDVAPHFEMLDQHGAQVSLWQFHGCTVVLDFSTGWCAPCQKLAEEAQAIADEYRDDGVRYLTVMPQDGAKNVPDKGFLSSWGDTFDLQEPILSDADGYTYDLVVPGSTRGYPAVLILDREGVVVSDVYPPTDEPIRAAIDAALER